MGFEIFQVLKGKVIVLYSLLGVVHVRMQLGASLTFESELVLPIYDEVFYSDR
jgi:hypothetical protein